MLNSTGSGLLEGSLTLKLGSSEVATQFLDAINEHVDNGVAGRCILADFLVLCLRNLCEL